MAVVRFSSLVTDIRGSICDGITFSNWKGKSYIRKRAKNIDNPQTARQVAVRDAMGTAGPIFKRKMSETDRAGWDAVARDETSASEQYQTDVAMSNHLHPHNGRSVLSGFNAFISSNMVRCGVQIPHAKPVQTPVAGNEIQLLETALTEFRRPDAPGPITVDKTQLPIDGSMEFNFSNCENYNAVFPGQDQLGGKDGYVEIWVRRDDKRTSRLAVVTGVDDSGTAINANVPKFNVLSVDTPWVVGRYEVQARVANASGFYGMSNAIVEFEITAGDLT